ncbi:MAG: TIGR04149 family rSAM-modified RiPP [Bacteroidales bacterium]|nr:TIGR04149 family rSAM-modified RiPP [Bacteroidales bacterium]MDY6002693.1 TIGR04149 family rSAM-modified RiPP [Candidatus Cryptobacteroides sp.]
MKKLKLNEVERDRLLSSEMLHFMGGIQQSVCEANAPSCSCSCYYANSGGSSIVDNSNANAVNGYHSENGDNQYIVHATGVANHA